VRGARSLYALHLGVGLLALGLLGGSAAIVAAGSDFSPPSADEISAVCAGWLSSGGPGAVLALAVAGLAATSLFLVARSITRQVRASRVCVMGLPRRGTLIVDGLACHRVERDQPFAFCAGYLRPRVYLSTGLIERLSEEELHAVVAHERHHLRRRDPLRRLIARALADGLFFVPILGRSSERYIALGELAADEAAVDAVGARRPIAAAFLKVSGEGASPTPVAGIDPERVDRLLGDPRSGGWRVPRTMAGWSALAVLALAALFLAASLVQPGLAWPLLLAAGCMAAMVGAPLLLGATALVLSGRALRARRSQ
jgi:hypothetical protein